MDVYYFSPDTKESHSSLRKSKSGSSCGKGQKKFIDLKFDIIASIIHNPFSL